MLNMENISTKSSRRSFVNRAAKVAAGAAALPGLFDGFVARAANERSREARIRGYGELKPAGNELALPPDFQYSVVSFEGDLIADLSGS